MCLNTTEGLKIVEGSWLREVLDRARRNRNVLDQMRRGVTLVDLRLVEDLVKLVKKYGTEACQCDIMSGYQCSIHNQVREELKEVLAKYELKIDPVMEVLDRTGWIVGDPVDVEVLKNL